MTGCSCRNFRRCAELRTAWRIAFIGALRLRPGEEGSRERWQDGKHPYYAANIHSGTRRHCKIPLPAGKEHNTGCHPSLIAEPRPARGTRPRLPPTPHGRLPLRPLPKQNGSRPAGPASEQPLHARRWNYPAFPHPTSRPPEAARSRNTPEIRIHPRVRRKTSPDLPKTQKSGTEQNWGAALVSTCCPPVPETTTKWRQIRRYDYH